MNLELRVMSSEFIGLVDVSKMAIVVPMRGNFTGYDCKYNLRGW